ncbi:MAG: bifunctional (p)ppGpp synthetase/guanosine-3',5'-bis(diphosphate) 3'-pyrophosphohydrolase [Acidobacteriota bacterium]|jgi:GTP pyrophosphokinase|nr:bifunctional (p)ppGpp synthetase/guanosine-3',5'-bis(diphosphate) 3'-pyrophosphohydrolase [Acidobacteriota bacterium]
MIRYEDIAEKVARYHPGDSVEMIQRGYVVSAKYHKGQLRMNGEPYLTHPLEVANILAEMEMDAVTVTAGLLHDVLEDTLISPDELRKQFGEEVYRLVDGVTKIAQMRLSSKQQKQAETFRKMLSAMTRDIRVLFLKLADRLHNMRTLQHLSPERRERISLETLELYAPLAHRLGMAKIRGELEDIAFSFLHPAAYQSTVAQIEAKRTVNQNFIMEAEKAISQALTERNIPVRLESRVKRIYSVYAKMKRQKISIDEVYDFIAIRVITDVNDNCYRAMGVLHKLWKPVHERIKDYIGSPRANLYQSLHTSVIGRNGQPFEIQIRTEEMHHVAEEGLAAHWKYKAGKLGAVDGEEHFRWLRQLIEMQQEVRNPREFLNNLKDDLYHDEIYCYTPRELQITLPRGATPVDFAYTIHSEIGNHCVAAKVNGRAVPLRYKLQNGETVEIETSESASPSREWLTFVKNARTRNKIRRFINQKERDSAADIGRKLMERESQRFSASWEKVLRMPELTQAIAKCGLRDSGEIYTAVGSGTLTPRQILSLVFPNREPSTGMPSKNFILSSLSSTIRQVFGKGSDKTAIPVKGHDGSLIYRAKCCNPIPGDDIVGYITLGSGIYVHMANCPSLKNLYVTGADRITEVEWADDSGDETYPARLNIDSEGQQQVMADVITMLSKAHINVVESRFRSLNGDGNRNIDMVINVADAKQLQEIIQGLKSIEGVNEVERERKIRGQ